MENGPKTCNHNRKWQIHTEAVLLIIFGQHLTPYFVWKIFLQLIIKSRALSNDISKWGWGGKRSSPIVTQECKLERHFLCIIKVAQMSATWGNGGDVPCRGSWEMAMMKLLTLHSESGSWHYKRCSFIVKLLNIASFGLYDTHASPLMQVTCMCFLKFHYFGKHIHAHHTGLFMSACVLYSQTEKEKHVELKTRPPF